jgi:uncharacterized protein YkwD
VPQHLRPPAHPRLRQGLGISTVLIVTFGAALGLFLFLRPPAVHPTTTPYTTDAQRLPASSTVIGQSASKKASSSSGSSDRHKGTPSKSRPRTSPRARPTAPTRPHPPRNPSTRPSSERVESKTTSRSSSPSSPGSSSNSSFLAQVVTLTNQQRSAAGCAPLSVNPNLTTAAQGHSDDMAVNHYFDHNSQNGDTPWDRITAAGYVGWTSAGENIAEGQATPQAVLDAWMNSAGHRANILNCSFNEIGVGYAVSDNGDPYWTQDFGQRNT